MLLDFIQHGKNQTMKMMASRNELVSKVKAFLLKSQE